ncbi:MAG: hypothetical protein AAFW68_12145, partial [Pseudomonadota bacterium]
MMQWARLIQAAILGGLLATAMQTSALAEKSSASGVKAGVAAYRAGDDGAAWRLLKPAADDGTPKAQRYLAYLMLDGRAPKGDEANFEAGVALLKQAAIAGDYAALIRLEDLRRRQLAHSPGLDDMIEIETARAEQGDPVAAW